MRAIGLIVFICAVLVYYLVNVYVSFFDNIRIANLAPPISKSTYHIGKSTGEKKTFIFLGDSLTAGVGTTSITNTIPYQTTQILAQNNNVTVRTFGYPGARVNSILLVSKQQKNEKSDLTVIFIGINDVFNRTPVKEFSQDLETIVANMKLSSTKIVLISLPFLGTNSSIPFPYDFLYNFQLNRYNNEIKTVADNNNLQLIDLYQLTNGKLSDPSLFASDAFHPSDRGYILIADIIAKELKKE